MVSIKPITGFYRDFSDLVLIMYFINTKNPRIQPERIGACQLGLPATTARFFLLLGVFWNGRKLLQATVAAKRECLAIAFNVERPGSIYGSCRRSGL
jgi:hypothetical protein